MMKTRNLLLITFFSLVLPVYSLSPPQYTYQRELFHSIGASPHVTVNDVVEENDGYRIDVIADEPAIAEGLAFILKDQMNFGGIQVTVHVLDAQGNSITRKQAAAEENPVTVARTHFLNALRDNLHFNKILDSSSPLAPYPFWLEFKPAVIQFANDNIGDFYGNNNAVAMDVFRDVIREDLSDGMGQTAISPGFTTALVKSDSTVPFFQTYH